MMALSLAACLIPSPTGKEGGPSVRLEREQTELTTDGDGIVAVDLDISRQATSFQITGSSDALVSFDRLVDPDGNVVLDWQDWLDSEESLTLGLFADRTTTALSWPIREEDGPLQPGTWTAWLSLYDPHSFDPADEVEVDLYADTKLDDNLDKGRVSVQVVWADQVEEERGVVNAVEEAIDRWRDIWGERGLTLEIDHVYSELDPDLDFWLEGDEEIEDLAREGKKGGLQLVIGDTVAGQEGLFGVSAGIPGTTTPSPHTFVVLSWLTHAGRDGEFDDGEIRLMGETMAHEMGHYTGLFHPVESDFQAWDALGDTDHCEGSSSCERELGENLMFPYPLCDGDGCSPQGELTSDQEGVMQRYAGTL
jgi:hypothetical protein